MGVAGFGAPVSKVLSIITAVVTFVVLSNKRQQTVYLVASRLQGEDDRWWRPITSLFHLASVLELILALHLVRMFRTLERHMGSAKFGSFLFLAAALTKSMELVLCVHFPHLQPPSGPLSILTALATLHHGYLPWSTKPYLTLGSLRVTDKVVVHLAVLMLAMQHSWNSLMPAACGILVAVLYRSRIFHLQRFRVPGKQMFAILGALFQSGNQIAARRTQMESLQQRNRVRAAQYSADGPTALFEPRAGMSTGLRQRGEVAAPSEDDVALLMGLGFERMHVVEVLRSTGNNKEAAANRLLGH